MNRSKFVHSASSPSQSNGALPATSVEFILCRYKAGKLEWHRLPIPETQYLSVSHVWGNAEEWSLRNLEPVWIEFHSHRVLALVPRSVMISKEDYEFIIVRAGINFNGFNRYPCCEPKSRI